ncbi:MAG: DNA polymerase clamp loader subunit A [Candidatus Levybacteria bacterium]|nr:DNA polymerase clamp loader subunit A [Candidatus Levybacteria bacterium]
MDKELNVFDVIKNINTLKDFADDTKSSLLKVYDPFVINKGMSLHPDTLLYSNEMNINNHLSNKMQYDYYIHSIRKRNRWAKWPKKTGGDNKVLEAISKVLSVNYKTAKNINKILTDSERNDIEKGKINEYTII